MRYLPTLDVWEPAISAAIDSGALRLQRGQWVKCGDSPYRSRIHEIKRRGGHVVHIRAFHGPDASRKFLEYCKAD